jgi:hypothetical protein
MVQLVRHPQTKERDTDRLHLNHRATSRLYCVRETRENPPNFGTACASRKGSRFLCITDGSALRRICPYCGPQQWNDCDTSSRSIQ